MTYGEQTKGWVPDFNRRLKTRTRFNVSILCGCETLEEGPPQVYLCDVEGFTNVGSFGVRGRKGLAGGHCVCVTYLYFWVQQGGFEL
jgi:hypothetical protein